MNTPNVRYYAKMVNTTQKGKKTPKYTITAQAGYYPPMEQQISNGRGIETGGRPYNCQYYVI